jgi:FixJ family two-component response regulator
MDVVPTVFIVEDSEEVGVALSRLLSAIGCKVRSFASAERFLNDQDAATPGCLLIDVCLPGLSGIELQHQLIGSQCARPIIFMTGMGDIQTSVDAMKAGAIDFLTKPIEPESLFAAIERALLRDAEQRMQHATRRMIETRLQALTVRERQVLAHLVRGRLNKQIAADLGIGEKTVKVHRARVMSKMAVRSIAPLVQLCIAAGIPGEPSSRVGAAVESDSPSATIPGFFPLTASLSSSIPCM